MDADSDSLKRVGGKLHDQYHREEHCRLYHPLFELAFGPVATWGQKHACVCFAGRGREAEFLMPYVQRLVLTDNYTSCIAYLTARFVTQDRPYITVRQGDGAILPVEPGSIDILTALVALMHIPAYSIREAFAREVVRVLRPGGRALIQLARTSTNSWLDKSTERPTDHYQVTDGGSNVGFVEEEEVYQWWGKFLRIEYTLRTPVYPPDGTMRNWWWLIGSRP